MHMIPICHLQQSKIQVNLKIKCKERKCKEVNIGQCIFDDHTWMIFLGIERMVEIKRKND